MLQFLKENALTDTFAALQRECQVSLNTVESMEGFIADINSGRWDAVLPTVAQLKLPRSKLEDLYEQVKGPCPTGNLPQMGSTACIFCSALLVLLTGILNGMHGIQRLGRPAQACI